MENKNMKRITNITYPTFALLTLACFALSPTAQAGKPHPSPTPIPTPTISPTPIPSPTPTGSARVNDANGQFLGFLVDMMSSQYTGPVIFVPSANVLVTLHGGGDYSGDLDVPPLDTYFLSGDCSGTPYVYVGYVWWLPIAFQYGSSSTFVTVTRAGYQLPNSAYAGSVFSGFDGQCHSDSSQIGGYVSVTVHPVTLPFSNPITAPLTFGGGNP
jgi:hypothetical protein